MQGQKRQMRKILPKKGLKADVLGQDKRKKEARDED